MKLRNKKTREIVEFRYLQSDYVAPLVLTTYENDKPEMYSYNSLAELNEEWEDYEEPKEYWTIDWTCTGVTTSKYSSDDIDEFNKSIGNYFETKEEAEKAVEKLKAWKRLKDKGFRILGYYHRLGEIKSKGEIGFEMDDYASTKQDLDLLFGGEE